MKAQTKKLSTAAQVKVVLAELEQRVGPDAIVAGVNEFVGLSIVAVVFLQMANTLREDRHVSNDLIMAWVGRSRPRVARFFYGLFHVIGAALMAFIVWYVIPIFQENYAGNYYKGTAGVIEIPVWPFMLVVIVGAGATVIQYLLLAAREFLRAFAPAGPRR